MSASSDELLLAIDCGTQSVRALLIDLKGNIVAKRQRTLDGYVSAQNGWLEHDAEAFWQASASVCRGLWRGRPELKPRTKGVVVTAQRGSLTLVDENGKALRPFIIWLDQRRAHRTPPIPLWWRAAFTAARVNATIDYLSKESELNWIAENEPERLARTHKVLLVSGWLNYRLTARFVDSVGSQVGYLPFDFKRHDWARAWDWKWSALAGHGEQMPDLVPVGSVLGSLTSDAAEATGLPAGLPVIAGAADKACEISWRRRDHARCRRNLLRDNGDDQRDYVPISRGDPLHSALSSRAAGKVHRRGPDLSRFLDGELVQAAVRPPRNRGRAQRRRGARSAFRSARTAGPAWQRRPDAAALLDPGYPDAGPGGARRGDRLHRRAHTRPSVSRHSRGARVCASRRL